LSLAQDCRVDFHTIGLVVEQLRALAVSQSVTMT